jgi:antitoxin component YwqK of YwqJK toxin-antitoxin module
MKKLVALLFVVLSIGAMGQTQTIDTTFGNPSKMQTITYKTNGKKTKELNYLQSGSLNSESNFKNGIRDGISIGYNYQETGKISSKTTYKNGVYDGLYETYNTAGKMVSSGNYQNGMMTGTWTYYNDDGTLRSIDNYKDGEHDGKVTTYYKNGKPESEFIYTNNAIDWTFTYYYENGNKQYSGAYKNDKMFGERLCYTEDGKLANGYFAKYSEQGLLEKECTCINGKPQGELKVYNYGRFSYSVNFKDGKPDGIAIYNNGKRKELYKNGVFVKEIKEEANHYTKP